MRTSGFAPAFWGVPLRGTSITRRRGAFAFAAAGSTIALVAVGGGGPSGGAVSVPRHQPVAFVHTHFEGGLEGLQSASGEQYDNRAYPRQYISPTQVHKARAAFERLSSDSGGGNTGKVGGGTVGSGSGSGPST